MVLGLKTKTGFKDYITGIKYWQDMKYFVEKISTKFAGFYFNKMNLVQTVL